MRVLVIFMLITLQFTLAGQDAIATRWDFFQSIEGKFRIKVPNGDMAFKTDTIDTGIGKVAYHTYFHQADQPDKSNVLYMVSYCDYPIHAMHSDSTELIEEFFESTIDAAKFSIAGDLVYTDDVELNGFPGKFWRIDYLQNQAVIKTKAFIVKNRYYSIQTVMFKKLSLNPDSDRFLESFGLL